MSEHFIPKAVVMRETAGVMSSIDESSQQQLSYLSAFAPETPIPVGVAFGNDPDQLRTRQVLLGHKLMHESDISGHVQLDTHIALLAQHRLPPSEQAEFRRQAQIRYAEQGPARANTPDGWGFYINAGHHALHLRTVQSSSPTDRQFWDKIILANSASGDPGTGVQLAEMAYQAWEPGSDRAGMAWRRAVGSNYLGRHKEASIWAQDAITESREYGGSEDQKLTYQLGIGRALYFLNETSRALGIFESLVRECREKIEQKGADAGSMEALAPMLLNRAQVKFDTGDFAAAYVDCKEARNLRELTIGRSHRFTLMDMSREGRSLAHAGDPEAALRLLQPALEELSETLGPVHYDTIYARAAMAEALRLSGDDIQGDQLASDNFEMAKEHLGPQNAVALCAGQVATRSTQLVRWTL